MTRKALLGRVSDVDIRLLRVFRAVVACGGVSAAELELNIGRSTISRHLTDLETRLGVKLCDRGPAGFALTVEGQQIFEASTHLVSALHTFEASVHEVHQRLSGRLAIALFDKMVSNPAAKISETIEEFDRIAPEVIIEIHKDPVNVIESGLLSGRFDLAITPTHRQSGSMDYFPLYSEQMYLYCGHHHPLFGRGDAEVTAVDVGRCKYAGIGFHSLNMIVSHNLHLTRHADVYDEEAMAALILSGRYLGFLPDHYAEPFVQTREMWRLRPDIYHYQSDHAAILRRSPRPSRLVKEFLGCLQRAHGTA
ncbi:LysR family transcriptional regulator [Pelagibius sp.]|uniref:LysR family transcriptional regulator n=1 Tax=Pelagibius sp. TaxID=1931238 RepID=UPI00261D3B14|nr:LysR family transcriptional regulator [Pelagibius sp.]